MMWLHDVRACTCTYARDDQLPPLACETSALVRVRPCKLSDRSGRRCIDVAPTVPVARTLMAPRRARLRVHICARRPTFLHLACKASASVIRVRPCKLSDRSGRRCIDVAPTVPVARTLMAPRRARLRVHICARRPTSSPLACKASALIRVRPCKLSDRSGRRCIDVAPTVPVARTLMAPQRALAVHICARRPTSSSCISAGLCSTLQT